ncbi:UNVERIFIED_CONTAM: hypothetical protein FKN15_051876 [Acipenser sinensis]
MHILGNSKPGRQYGPPPCEGSDSKAAWLKHFIRDVDSLTYIFPGINSITIGGMRQKDDWNSKPGRQYGPPPCEGSDSKAAWLKRFIRDGDGLTYIFPGINSITIGGMRQKDDWCLTADPKDSSGVFERYCALEPSLKKSQVLTEWVGL